MKLNGRLCLCWLAGAGSFALARTPPVVPTHLVTFAEQPLAVNDGSVPGLAATTPSVLGTRKLDARSAASRAYLDWLAARQAVHLRDIERVLGRSVEVRFSYRAAGNGVALRLEEGEADRIRAVPGVTDVTPDAMYPLVTNAGPFWIGGPAIWTGSGTGGLGPSKGEGIIVGTIDSGINLGHPSFSDAPIDGYTYINPFGPGVHIGDCGGLFVCNEKLVGAWDFADGFGNPPEADGPEDAEGHGSMTASIAAGNVLGDPALTGVAPHATLITYDACVQGNCPLTATAAALDQAVLDGVDVLNYSIANNQDPWTGLQRSFLDAMAAGVFVSAAAGNSGPGPETLSNISPWTATVGSSTHHRETPIGFKNGLVSMSGGASPPADMVGASATSTPHGAAPVVYAGDFGNGTADPWRCDAPFPAGTWSGQIVVCDDGGGNPGLKGQNVLAGGAGGMVLAAVGGRYDLVFPLPTTVLDAADGAAVKAWLGSGTGHAATITAATPLFDPTLADIMASYSSRGPSDLDALKPDLAAPGSEVIAACAVSAAPPGYQFPSYCKGSGTSFAAPHVTGAVALLEALHPTWTGPQVKSALMTTAHTALFKEDGVTPTDPFDVGAGRVDLTVASRAGLILDESYANFLAADPSTGGDPRTLNLPSYQSWDCSRCSFTRTVEATAAATWTVTTSGTPGLVITVTPSSFTLAAGGRQQLTIDIDATALPFTWAFGEIALTPSGGSVTPSHFPVALRWPDVRGFDIVAGEGLGQPNPNRVRAFYGSGRATPVDFLAYAAGQWGTNVATGNVAGAIYQGIVTGPGPGPVFGPQVRGFNKNGTVLPKVNFYAYGTLRYGVNPAAGDVDNDASYEEILTAPGPGAVFGPHIRGWNFDNASIAAISKISYFAYGTLKYGANVDAGSLDADAYAELLTGAGPGAIFAPQVRGWQYDATAVTSIAKVNFLAFPTPQFGVNVSSGDADADGFAEIVASPGPGGSASFPARFLGFDYDGVAVSALPGFDATVGGSRYGGRPAMSDESVLATGAGPDPAVDSRVTPHLYDGAALVADPSGFVPFGLARYGVTVSVGRLGF